MGTSTIIKGPVFPLNLNHIWNISYFQISTDFKSI